LAFFERIALRHGFAPLVADPTAACAACQLTYEWKGNTYDAEEIEY